MRVNLVNGNGFLCDVCTKEIPPFNGIIVKCQKTEKGPKYPDVSSDIVQKQINKFHLCKRCYGKLENLLSSKAEKTKEIALSNY